MSALRLRPRPRSLLRPPAFSSSARLLENATTAAAAAVAAGRSSVPDIALAAEPTKFEEEGGPGPAAAAAADDLPPRLRDILERRSQAGRLVAGVAAASNSDMFKGPTGDKPKAKAYGSHMSSESRSRQPCNLKMAARHLKNPGLLSLGGGLPSSEYFPITALSMQVPTPPNFSEAAALASGQTIGMGKYDTRGTAAGGIEQQQQPSGVYDLSIALNYAQATGSPQLLRFITEHTELVHNPPYADWHCAATIGSTGSLEQVLRMLCVGLRRSRPTSILTDDFSFSTALETMIPMAIHPVGVRTDGEGIVPEAIDEVLARWDKGRDNGPRAHRPTALYTVPTGHNPTGVTMGERRRRELYAVCEKHDLVIIEDDPYYFIQMNPYDPSSSPPVSGSGSGSVSGSAPPPPPLSPSPFLSSLLPSLLSLDTSGRVVRLDSFSKMLIPGSRMGWITAPAPVVRQFVMHSEVANQGPSGLSQLVLHRLLDETWGHAGFLRWLAHLRDQYARRRDTMLRACDEHLPRDVVSWDPPRAGMFLWLRVDPARHPRVGSLSLVEMEKEIFAACIKRGVLVARGSWFHAERLRGVPLTGLYFRTTYASASEGDMSEAVRRFGEAVRASFGME